jgi:CBS domain-containing protein
MMRSDNMKCYEIMTPDPKVCIPEDDLADVAEFMWTHDSRDSMIFGDLPVVSDLESRELIGMVRYRDLAIHMLGHSYEHPSKVKVSECMSSSVVACRAEDTVETVAQLMSNRGVGRMPVVDENGCCIGTVSWANLLSHGFHTGPVASGATAGYGSLT